MKGLIAFLCFVYVGSAQANDLTLSDMEHAGIEYYTKRAEACGEYADNLLCYFTPEEIQKALGMSPAEALSKGLLDPAVKEKFNWEDIDNNGDFVFDFSAKSKDGDKKTSTEATPIPKPRPENETKSAEVKTEAVPLPKARPDIQALEKEKEKAKENEKKMAAQYKPSPSNPRVRALIGYRNGAGAPVWGRFINTLKNCQPGCVPVDYNAFRQGAFSCHNFGRAIDVGGIACDGKPYYAYYQGRYADLVRCAKRNMKVLYRNGKGITEGHYDHGHFSIGCRTPEGGGYW